MNKKIIIKMVSIVFVLFIVVTNVFGFGDGFDPNIIPGGMPVADIKTPVQKIWGSFSLIIQVCAVGGIIFTGIRYMFAPADAKGEMKKTLPFLIIGIVIVFASPYVINFIVKVVDEVM